MGAWAGTSNSLPAFFMKLLAGARGDSYWVKTHKFAYLGEECGYLRTGICGWDLWVGFREVSGC
eukprot:scaffold87340_cov67-Phaeocystis_antarctica.AAC.1